MTTKRLQPFAAGAWALASRQHGVVTRAQLLGLGLSPRGIRHRLETGRLHRVRQGVYAVGRPDIDARGRWMAAVLSCGPHALLAGRSAAELWGLANFGRYEIEVAVPAEVYRRRPGIRIRRHTGLGASDRSERERIPVTDVATTLIDLARVVDSELLAKAVNAADRANLIDPERLRDEIVASARPGAGRLRRLLDRQAFRRTDSYLERRFLALIRRSGLPAPQTQASVNGFRVDFYWPALGLVVETDGLRYHRTPEQQGRDLKREQVHAAAGLTALRFSAAQVRDEPTRVVATMREVLTRLERSRT